MPIQMFMVVRVEPDHEVEWRAAAKVFLAASRAAPGVLSYELSQEFDEERRFVWSAVFTDEAAMERHMDSDAIHAFAASALHCVATLPTIVTTRPVDLD